MNESKSETLQKYELFHPDKCMLIHFTDINFLPSIFSDGINFAYATYDYLGKINKIGDEDTFGGARGTYRILNERVREGIKQMRDGTVKKHDKKDSLEMLLNWQRLDEFIETKERILAGHSTSYFEKKSARMSTKKEFIRFKEYRSLY